MLIALPADMPAHTMRLLQGMCQSLLHFLPEKRVSKSLLPINLLTLGDPIPVYPSGPQPSQY